MVKVIHVVENLDKGAVENWLVRMFCFGIDNGYQLDWTFYCILDEEGRLDKKVLEHGGKVLYSPVPLSQNIAFIRNLRKTLKIGKYDVLHCHHDLVSGIYLLAAVNLPINLKIVHVHNADEVIPTSNRAKEVIFRYILRRFCWFSANKIVGISQHTLDRFLLNRGRRVEKDIVHYYGVNSKQFLSQIDRYDLRKSLNMPLDAKIVLFASRIDKAKNPFFALEVMRKMVLDSSDVYGLFVGQGQFQEQLKTKIEDFGLGTKIQFLGWRDDIAEIMKSCDLFLLPHVERPKEGLGLVLLEAQLACLPLLISTGIANDPILPGTPYCQLSLNEGTNVWVKKGFQLMQQEKLETNFALNKYKNSPFDMQFAIKDLLTRVYSY